VIACYASAGIEPLLQSGASRIGGARKREGWGRHGHILTSVSPAKNLARTATQNAVDPPTTARSRRSSDEVRHLILDAARQLFAANGFRGTSTREIADTAGVAEVLLFRNFGSKADLYSTAVVLPLTRFLEEWLESDWSGWDTARTEERQYEFIAQLYDIVCENRGLIMSYLAMSVFEPDIVTGLEHSRALDEVLDRMAEEVQVHFGRLGGHPGNLPVGTRAVVAMILAMGLFHDLGASAPTREATRDDVIEEMTQLVLHGALHRKARPSAPSRSRRRTS
jgi:AcrR family transcriptional regulator